MKTNIETVAGLTKHKEKHTAEAFQSLDVKFAFLNKVKNNKYKQIHTEIKCRDFLGDCLWGTTTRNKVNIYGFTFNPIKSIISQEGLFLSLLFPDNNSMSDFKTNFPTLREKERQLGLVLSEMIETDKERTLIISADKVWQSAIWKLSLYTFYLKVISYETPSCAEDPENGYLDVLSPDKEEKLLSKLHDNNEVLYETIHLAHNYSGFVSILTDRNKVMNRVLLGE